ncbi:MAG: hypothetical protein R2792_02440 [Saprospiraceae bacterium]
MALNIQLVIEEVNHWAAHAGDSKWLVYYVVVPFFLLAATTYCFT